MRTAPAVHLAGSASIAGAPLFGPVSLTLKAGGWTCLLGASGVGKSTILRLIAGLDTEADFDGRIEADDKAPVADRVAYMAQEDLLMPWADLRKNITLGARLRRDRPDPARLDALLERCGLRPHAHKRPGALSGGQRQRVALARTLMEDKEIILLDEPFSALDARTRADMQDLAFDLLKGRTVLLVTHDPGEAVRLGEQIVLMTENGLRPITAPAPAAPRGVDDPETLEAQGALMALLRRGTA